MPTDTPEHDPRFPSGEWTGFFLQPSQQRHPMSLHLHFHHGAFTGDGTDPVGPFSLRGTYDTHSGDVQFLKTYIRRHAVRYKGCNEGKGIWGLWSLPSDRGGFHIWPKSMPDPTARHLHAQETAPLALPSDVESEIPA
jgi:hypothetical protein